ncbi:MAG: hypothetical protein IJE10_01035 [Clostridia bacterium]|nr:hypothetical protein [Clostridia bacterium]
MKKSCAMKLLAVALVVILTMSTGLSAMAASVTSFTRYDGDTVNVETQVTGLDEESMVTYLVTDNTSLAATTDAKIKAIDQVNVGNNTAVEFGYTTTADAIETDKIYVGADTWTAATESGKVKAASGANVVENGIVSEPLAANMELLAEEGEATAVTLAGSTSDKVAYVLVDGAEVDFAIKDTDEIYVFEALTKDTIINIGYYAPIVTAASIIDAMPETLEKGTHFVSSNTGAQSGTVGFLNARQFSADDNNNSYGDALKAWYKTTEAKTANMILTGAVIKKVLAGTPGENGSVAYDGGSTNADNVSAAEYAVIKELFKGQEAELDDATEYTIPVNYGSGQDWIMHVGSSNSMDTTLNVPVAGTYTLAFRIGAYQTTRVPKVAVNGGSFVASTMYSEISGGEGDPGCIATVDVALNAGENTIAIRNNASSVLRFDFMVALAKDAMADKVLEQMDNARGYATGRTGGYVPALDTVTGIDVYSDVVVTLGKVVQTENSITAFARATGDYSECGITVDTDNYKALAVSDGSDDINYKGAYAVELYSDDAADIEALAGTAIKAYADEVVSETKYIQ